MSSLFVLTLTAFMRSVLASSSSKEASDKGACPVEAFAEGRYDVPKCVNHIAGPSGTECLTGGCLARRACPVGRDYAYAPDQARFHMEAFLRANRGKS